MMCEGCSNDHHELCGMQTWCTCDCPGPDGVYLDDGDGDYPEALLYDEDEDRPEEHDCDEDTCVCDDADD